MNMQLYVLKYLEKQMGKGKGDREIGKRGQFLCQE